MKLIIKLGFLLLLCSGNLLAQTGMMSNSASKDAVLDLNNTDGTAIKGLLLPKVALTDSGNSAPLSAHIAGMHVYNTANGGSGTTLVSPGEYYNDGSKWIRVDNSAWALTGNVNTNPAVNFIGTVDSKDLAVKTNNIEKLRVTAVNGNVLVGTTAVPTGGTNAELIVNNGTTNGALQIKDGTQASGYVFTSDANGLGTWKKAAQFGSKVGQWSLSGTLNITTSLTVESGTSTIVSGDEIGLTALSNGVKIPQGNYMVYIKHDIGYSEMGYYCIQNTLGNLLYETYYNEYLSGQAFYLQVPAGGYTLQSAYRHVNTSIPYYPTAPYTMSMSQLVTFLKI